MTLHPSLGPLFSFLSSLIGPGIIVIKTSLLLHGETEKGNSCLALWSSLLQPSQWVVPPSNSIRLLLLTEIWEQWAQTLNTLLYFCIIIIIIIFLAMITRLPVICNVLRFLLLTVIHLFHSLTHSFTYSSFVSFLLHSLNGQSISVMVSVQGSTAGGGLDKHWESGGHPFTITSTRGVW